MAFLDPRVVLRRRATEPVLRVVVHQRDSGGERARALALRLAHRPQPRGVDVGVADGHGTVTCGVAEVLRQRRRDQTAGSGDIRDAVEYLGQQPLQSRPSWVVVSEGAHDTVEHLDVVGE